MHPDPKRLKQLNQLIDKNKEAIFRYICTYIVALNVLSLASV